MLSPQDFIPFVDLRSQHRALRVALDAAIDRVIDSSGFILGEDVSAFEREMATFLDVRHAIGLSSGTDAIHLVLRALGIGPGDEVIVPAFTFIASAAAITMSGASPVFADIDPGTYHLSAADTARRITPRTKAIVVVHLYGQAVNLTPFQELARSHGLRLIEDACQAHGARWEGRAVGTIGDAGCFSFYPSKNLGALGDGGMAVTNGPDLAATIRCLSHHGQAVKNRHDRVGYTNRLDGIQAAVLRVKLPHLKSWNLARFAAAERYHALLEKLPLTLPRAENEHVYHVYTVRATERDQLLEHLKQHGIQAAVHYPVAVHQQPAYRDPARMPLPEAERAAREVLSLPIFPELTMTQQERVAEVLTQRT